MIDRKLVKQGVIVARREVEDKYWWGDSAIKLIGSAGEGQEPADRNARKTIAQWLDEIVEASHNDGGVPLAVDDLPTVNLIITNHRQGSSALPPELRSGVAISTARVLLPAAPFERSYVINTLRANDEPITIDAAKDMLQEMRALGVSEQLRPDLTWEDIEDASWGKLKKIVSDYKLNVDVEAIAGGIKEPNRSPVKEALRDAVAEALGIERDEQQEEQWTWEALIELAWDELVQIVDEYSLDVNVDDYEDENELRNAIADAVGIPSDSDEQEGEELTWADVKKLSRAQLDKVIVDYKLNIDRTKAVDMKIGELRAKVARGLGIKVPVEESKPAKVLNEHVTVAAWKLMSKAKQAETLAIEGDKRKRFNEQTNESIGWAPWSWNPITGCLHPCPYCFARVDQHRHNRSGEEDPFTPMLWPQRFTIPYNMPLRDDSYAANRVFAGSEADIFGKWVPTEWIQRILDIMADTPQWEYLMLTKFPQRLSQFEWPENVWAGTTIDTQARMRTASKWMPKVKAGVVWASCEPLLEEFKFDDEVTLGWANFVVAGSQTKTVQPNGVGVVEAIPVTIPALASLYNEVKAHGISFYTKSNMTGPTADPGKSRHQTNLLPGIEPIQEFPR